MNKFGGISMTKIYSKNSLIEMLEGLQDDVEEIDDMVTSAYQKLPEVINQQSRLIRLESTIVALEKSLNEMSQKYCCEYTAPNRLESISLNIAK